MYLVCLALRTGTPEATSAASRHFGFYVQCTTPSTMMPTFLALLVLFLDRHALL